jgi:hypothetical protein
VLVASARYPDLSFTLWFWNGCDGFKGCLVARAGEVLKDESHDYFGPRGG